MGNYGNKKTDYTYDFKGNITEIVYPTKDSDKVDEKREYNYNELNRLISSDIVNNKTNKTESYVYEYDEVGNMTSKANILSDSNKNNTVYTYNDLNQLVSSETSNLSTGKTTSKKTYSYDEKKTSHHFVGLEGNTISTMRYKLSGLEYYVYNKDIKGSTTNIVDNKNAKISYKYSDFGETEEFGDTDFYNEIAYTGGIYDESTSLYYLNARYYNPEDARFITQDTYRGQSDESTSLHLYAYCANDPINYIDPSGHSKWRYSGYGIQVAISIPFIDLALDIVWFSRNVKGFNTSSPYKAHAYICASGGGINKNDVLEKIIKNPSSLMKPSSVKNLLKKFPKINKVISRVGISLYYFHFGINKSYKTYKDYQGLGGAVNATFLHASAFGAIANGQITAGIGVSTSTFGLSFSFSKSVFHEGLTRNARSIGKTIMNYISKQSEKQWKKYYNKHK